MRARRRILTSPTQLAGVEQLRGDVGQLASGHLRRPPQQGRSLVRGHLVALHQDAGRLTDELARFGARRQPHQLRLQAGNRILLGGVVQAPGIGDVEQRAGDEQRTLVGADVGADGQDHRARPVGLGDDPMLEDEGPAVLATRVNASFVRSRSIGC